jgi:hypothetical protein
VLDSRGAISRFIWSGIFSPGPRVGVLGHRVSPGKTTLEGSSLVLSLGWRALGLPLVLGYSYSRLETRGILRKTRESVNSFLGAIGYDLSARSTLGILAMLEFSGRNDNGLIYDSQVKSFDLTLEQKLGTSGTSSIGLRYLTLEDAGHSDGLGSTIDSLRKRLLVLLLTLGRTFSLSSRLGTALALNLVQPLVEGGDSAYSINSNAYRLEDGGTVSKKPTLGFRISLDYRPLASLELSLAYSGNYGGNRNSSSLLLSLGYRGSRS